MPHGGTLVCVEFLNGGPLPRGSLPGAVLASSGLGLLRFSGTWMILALCATVELSGNIGASFVTLPVIPMALISCVRSSIPVILRQTRRLLPPCLRTFPSAFTLDLDAGAVDHQVRKSDTAQSSPVRRRRLSTNQVGLRRAIPNSTFTANSGDAYGSASPDDYDVGEGNDTVSLRTPPHLSRSTSRTAPAMTPSPAARTTTASPILWCAPMGSTIPPSLRHSARRSPCRSMARRTGGEYRRCQHPVAGDRLTRAMQPVSPAAPLQRSAGALRY